MSLDIPFSVLDFSPVRSGETPREALQQSVDLARHVEALGFKRFWVSEHHGSPSVAGAATSVVIGHVAGKTLTIRVGSGGVMLPNHTPLIVVEQFGTLASLYPGRIDLGLGRAAGAATEDAAITRALRLSPEARERFPSDVKELQALFREPRSDQDAHAVPGAGLEVPIWLLGSSTFSAAQAAALGLPFVFATQIGPDKLDAAVETYRSGFEPSEALDRPNLMICVFVIAAETDEEAQHLLTSIQQIIIARLRGTPSQLPPPRDLNAIASMEEQARMQRAIPYCIVGSRRTVRRGIEALITRTKADELIVLTLINDQEARHRSFEMVAEIRDDIAAHRGSA